MSNTLQSQTVVITGANSGLGYEAAAQLAEKGYGRVVLGCRTIEKADAARQSLVERVGRDPFESLQVDVSSVTSSAAAAAELIRRGYHVDRLLLNAGMVPGDKMQKSVDGLELAFATSIVGHHVLAVRLLEAGRLENARVVIAGSEAANGDLPAMMEMKLYDFGAGEPQEFGDNLEDSMLAYARGSKPELFNGTRYYAVAKLFTAWWAEAMAHRFGDRLEVYNVSPGANMATNVARHASGFKKFLFTKVMPVLGPLLGMDQPIAKGARRYIDALLGCRDYRNGGTYASKPGKLVGPVQEMTHAHLLDKKRQETAWNVLVQLTGVAPNISAR